MNCGVVPAPARIVSVVCTLPPTSIRQRSGCEPAVTVIGTSPVPSSRSACFAMRSSACASMMDAQDSIRLPLLHDDVVEGRGCGGSRDVTRDAEADQYARAHRERVAADERPRGAIG